MAQCRQAEASLDQGTNSHEIASKTVSFETQAPRYEWLKEVEVTVPKYFLERKERRLFLEKVRASQARRSQSETGMTGPSFPEPSSVVKEQKRGKQAKTLHRATSLPLSSDMPSPHQGEKRLDQGINIHEKATKTVSFETQASRYEWLKEVEVAEPKYFLERKNRRMFLEKVRASQGYELNKK